MGYSYQPNTTICRYCGEVSTCHYMSRMFCPSYKECSRLYGYSIKSMFDIEKQDRLFVSYTLLPLGNKKFGDNLLIFREYLWNQVRPDLTIMKEPLLQYKQWENYLREHAMPITIKSLIKKQEPLPRELPTPIKIKNPDDPDGKKVWRFVNYSELQEIRIRA